MEDFPKKQNVDFHNGLSASVSAFTCPADGDLLLVLHQEVLHHLSCLAEQANETSVRINDSEKDISVSL